MAPRDISIPWASSSRAGIGSGRSRPGVRPARPQTSSGRTRRCGRTCGRMDDGRPRPLRRQQRDARPGRLGARPPARRPAEPRAIPARRSSPGLEHLEVLEVLTTRAVAASMRARHADVRVQSATLANLAVYAGLTPVGATIAALPAWAGGHFSHHARGRRRHPRPPRGRAALRRRRVRRRPRRAAGLPRPRAAGARRAGRHADAVPAPPRPHRRGRWRVAAPACSTTPPTSPG